MDKKLITVLQAEFNQLSNGLANVPKDVPLNVPLKRDKIQRAGSLKSCFV